MDYMCLFDKSNKADDYEPLGLWAFELYRLYGEPVWFNKDTKNIFGIVKRINCKTVTIETNSGQQWRVACAFLYRIHDVEISMNFLQNKKS